MKQREYLLGGKNPPRTPLKDDASLEDSVQHFFGAKFVDVTPEEESKDGFIDHIPMHREAGDSFSFPFQGKQLTGSVHRAWKYLTLIEASDGEFYVEDTRKPIDKQIRQLSDADRCTHCGDFFCTPDCPNYNSAEAYIMSKKSIISIQDVLEIEPGTDKEPAWVNDIVECVVTNVKEAKGKGPVSAILTMVDDEDVKIKGIFWRRDYDDVNEWEGKLVQLQDGLIRTEYKPERGPKIQQLVINAKTEVEVVGESADSKRPLPHSKASAPDNGRDAPKRQESGNTGVLTDVLRRAKCYFGVLLRTEKAYAEAKEAGLETELSPTDLKDVATHISMTYRGDYGCYAEPIFEKNGAPKEKLDEMPDQEWGNEQDGRAEDRLKNPPTQSTERNSSWKDFVWKDGKKLGDTDESKLLSRSRWAFCLDEAPEDKEGKLGYANLKVMMAEKKWDKVGKLLATSLICSSEDDSKFTEADINAYLQKEYGKDLEELDNEEATAIIGDFDNVVEGITELAAKNKKPTKKAKAAMPE